MVTTVFRSSVAPTRIRPTARIRHTPHGADRPVGPRCRRGALVRPWLAAQRPRRGLGARRDPRAPGHGLRRARRPASGHRPLHVDRVPRGLRDLRPVARAGPRSRLLGVAADLRRDHTAPGDERPGKRDRAGGDAGPAGRSHRDRPRARQARVRRRPAVERGAGRLHERPRDHHHRGAAAEAVRLLHRRRRLRRRAARVVRAPRRHQGRRARRRPGRARRAPRVAALPAQDPRGPDRGGRRHDRVGGARPRRARRRDRRHAAAGVPEAVDAVDVVQRRRPVAPRGDRHRAGVAHRHHRDRVGVRRPARRRAATRTRR